MLLGLRADQPVRQTPTRFRSDRHPGCYDE